MGPLERAHAGRLHEIVRDVAISGDNEAIAPEPRQMPRESGGNLIATAGLHRIHHPSRAEGHASERRNIQYDARGPAGRPRFLDRVQGRLLWHERV
jgi:hypothetical protein